MAVALAFFLAECILRRVLFIMCYFNLDFELFVFFFFLLAILIKPFYRFAIGMLAAESYANSYAFYCREDLLWGCA